MSGISQLQALSPVGRCKTFDSSGDGYGRGEGCAVAVLQRRQAGPAETSQSEDSRAGLGTGASLRVSPRCCLGTAGLVAWILLGLAAAVCRCQPACSRA